MVRIVVFEVVPAKFDPGQVVMTPGAQEAFERTGEDPVDFLKRHIMGDWGDVDNEDKAANDWGLTTGRRLLSAYSLTDGTKFWIISEASREYSTLFLPEEY